MADVTIRPVRSKADERRFIVFIYTHYHDSKHWVPPLRMERRKLIDTRKNPFYQHAERELFLAERAGRVVGRIGAIVNRNHNRHHNDRVGFFGFFESIDDQAVAAALNETAKGYLRGRGMDAMRGPANPSVNDEYGLLVEGFDLPPAVMMPYNPPYYAKLLEGCGLRKAKDLYAYRGATQTTLEIPRSSAPTKSLKTQRADLSFARHEEFTRKDRVNQTDLQPRLAGQLGRGSNDRCGVRRADQRSEAVVRPELVIIAETAEGAVAGFGLSLPDINIVLKDNRGGDCCADSGTCSPGDQRSI